MKRHHSPIVSILSLAPCVICLILWLWRLNHRQQWSHTDAGGTTYFLVSEAGALHLTTQAVSTQTTKLGELDTSHYGAIFFKPGLYIHGMAAADCRPPHRFLGFEFGVDPQPIAIPFTGPETTSFTVFCHALAIPYWAILLLTAALPSLRLASLLRTRRRLSLGLCPACGYDLRASPETCPECGAQAHRQGMALP